MRDTRLSDSLGKNDRRQSARLVSVSGFIFPEATRNDPNFGKEDALTSTRVAAQVFYIKAVAHGLISEARDLQFDRYRMFSGPTTSGNYLRLILILVFFPALICRGEESAAGRWEGSVQIPERELKVVVDLAQQGNGGAWIGSIIIPGLNIKGAALSDIAVNGREITFAIKSALAADGAGPPKFKAQLAGDETLSGDFVQAGNSAPFRLMKIGPPQVELPPKSTNVSQEIEGEWKGEYELFGYARHVTVKLTNHSAAGAAAEFVVLGKKTNNLPVDLVTQEGDLLTINSHETGISYEGRLDRKAGEIKGTFTQGPIDLPLVLRRGQ